MADPTVFSIPRRRMFIQSYATGTAIRPLRDVGVINSAEVTFNRETNEYRAVDLSGTSCLEYVADTDNEAANGTLAVEMMSTVAANLGVMLSSAVTATGGGASATGAFASGVVANDCLSLPDLVAATGVTITDSTTGTPQTLTLGTDYEWVAKSGNVLRVLATVTGFVQPLKYSGTEVAQKTINPMSSLSDYYSIALAGANERGSCAAEKEVFYRVRVSDAQTKQLHAAAEVKVAQPMTVNFTIDRDPARSYAFGSFKRNEA